MNYKIIFTIISLWLAWHLAIPIDLGIADLGRHLKNGELILQGRWEILYQNVYSFILPHYPFINHHWLFGVFIFLIWHCFGFVGASIVYISLCILSFNLFISRFTKAVSLALLAAFSLLSLPLIASRMEIRPESLSLLYVALMWLLTDRLMAGRIKQIHYQVLLVLIQIAWVNSHIYFFFGPLFILCWLIQAKFDKEQDKAKVLIGTFFLLLLACLINPSGLSGALLPFQINHQLGYGIIEQQSVFFMLPHYQSNPIYAYFLVSIVISFVGWIWLIKIEGIKKHFFKFSILALMTLGATLAVRLIGPYGYFWGPLTAYAWGRVLEKFSDRVRKIIICIFLMAGVMAASLINFDWKRKPEFDLKASGHEAADFFKKEHLKGPIFNNYDIGGYLIFYLAPQEGLFVDNRAEAFPPEFFKKMYIPMQANEDFWQAMQQYYQFKVIFFNRNDQTPWSRKFILRRLHDPAWSPVFVDEALIILVRRIPEFADVIRRCEFKLEKVKPDKHV